MTDYRTLHEGEDAELMTLWRDVLGNSDDQSQQVLQDFGLDLDWRERTFVAVREGEIIASAKYWLREVHDAHGQPQRVGHVLGMATRPEMRRQGHASRLLQLAVEAMRREGCLWSILFTRAEARSLYERHGWRSFPKRWWRGAVGNAPIESSSRYVVRAFDPRDGYGRQAIAKVYAAYNAYRPLTIVRDDAYWRGFAAWMLNDWMTNHGTVVLGAFDPAANDHMCGYTFVNFHPQGFWVSEWAALREHRGAIDSLLAATVREQARRGFAAQGGVEAAMDAEAESTLRMVFGDTLHRIEASSSFMARPVALEYSNENLKALFASRESKYWELDSY